VTKPLDNSDNAQAASKRRLSQVLIYDRNKFGNIKMTWGTDMMELVIRRVRPEDLERITEIEAACFPVAEAARRDSFRERIETFPETFLVAEMAGSVIGFINGCVTNSPVIYDELFYSTEHHEPEGKYAAVFGLDVLPEHRRQGIAASLMRNFIKVAKDAGREGIILTCKSRLVSYYEAFGYVNSGVSASTHGGAEWYDMTLMF
jgi:ribosomal protein S18 acetylase RimI-like enzyme